jgi:hypothetical protein
MICLFEIEEFADSVKKAAVKYKVQYLTCYADKLVENIRSFDVDEIKSTVNEFHHVYESIKSAGSTKK